MLSGFLQGLFDVRAFIFGFQRSFFQLFDLTVPAEQVRTVFLRAAGDRTAAVQKLAFQCYDAEIVMIFASDRQRVVNIRDHENISQKMFRELPILRVDVDQIAGTSDGSALVEGFTF